VTVERLSKDERDRLEEFSRIVRQAQRELANRIQTATRAGDLDTASRRRVQLARVADILDELGAEIDPRARRIVRDAYQRGAVEAARQMTGIGVPPGGPATVSFNGVSAEAVETLQDAIVGRLDESRTYIGRQTRDMFAKAGRRAALLAVVGVDGTPAAAKRRMAADLLRDREPGSRRTWSLDDYCSMAVQTVTREATVQGAIARMTTNGIALARVSSHSGACATCQQYEGRLVDLGSGITEHEGEAVMSGPVPPYHPRCRHSLGAVAVRIDEIRRELAGSA
jgi:hypothetical protein